VKALHKSKLTSWSSSRNFVIGFIQRIDGAAKFGIDKGYTEASESPNIKQPAHFWYRLSLLEGRWELELESVDRTIRSTVAKRWMPWSVRAAATVTSLLTICVTHLGELPTNITKLYELLGCQNLTNRKLSFEPQAGHVRFRCLKFFEPCLVVGIGKCIGVDRHVEVPRGLVHTSLCAHHLRPAFLVHPTDLLHLLGRQSQLGKEIRTTIILTIRRRSVTRWGTDLTKQSGRTGQHNCE
jgi:hypothetical protein